MTDTIFALSSGAPPSAIAVIRISGPGAFDAVSRMTGSLPPPRRASLRRLHHPVSGEPLDRGLVILFPGPETASGEDLAELHLHGGLGVIRAVQSALGEQEGVRQAQAGEFTRRALEAGRIDLTEAEGLADLLAAETEAQRRAALRSSEGGLRRLIEEWNDRVVALSAMIEAAIDHSDEADAADEDAIVARVRSGAEALASEIAALLAQPPAERLRDGIRVVLAGPPNSGKSTLFNALAARDAAIVSPIAGTTRDRIEAPVVHSGLAWLLTDTAGLAEQTDDPIEAIGIERTRQAVEAADVILWLGDALPETTDGRLMLLHPRADVPGREAAAPGRLRVVASEPPSVAELWRALFARGASLVPSADVPSLNTRQRHLCCDAQFHLQAAGIGDDPLIVAEELRLTRQRFDKVTGRTHIEHVLDALFGSFCIGK